MIPRLPESRRTGLSIAILACVAVTLAVMAPYLWRGYYCILDSSNFYDMASRVRLLQPATYLDIPFLENRARPATLILFIPAYWVKSATAHYWVQTLLLLTLPSILWFWLVYQATGRVGWALLGVLAAVCQPSFTENYYTVFKAEPWILLGVAYVSWLLWLQLWGNVGVAVRGVAHVGALVATACIYLTKEPGGAFLGVYLVGALILAWGSGLSWRECLRRLWMLSLMQVVGFIILVVSVLRLPTFYSASGTSEYSLQLAAVVSGVVRVGGYFIGTSSYLLPAVCLLILGWRLGEPSLTDPNTRRAVRKIVAWGSYFVVMTGGMLAALIPWQALEARQYLVAASAAPLAAVCACAVGVILARWVLWRGTRALVYALTVMTLILLVLHVVYACVTGIMSEGQVRYKFDRAYEEMFRHVAQHASHGGTVYFLMDERLPEPRQNTVLGMRVFYNRPDLQCLFPKELDEFWTTGLVVVSDYAVPLNYNRMPLHHEAQAWFDTRMAPRLGLVWLTSFVYQTEIWYATNTYHGPQYRSVWGVPAFWDLKRGVYRFGWRIYALTNVPEIAEDTLGAPAANLLANSSFTRGLAGWSPWGVERTNQLYVVRAAPDSGSPFALRIENPRAELIGLKQHVPLVSGEVYRLRAAARSLATNDATRIFGGRVAVYLPPQPEQQLIWMSEYNRWWQKELVFTNQVTGTAVVYVHLGYGNVATTGEFTGIRLERVGQRVVE